ncbi:glycosyltransferase [Paracoccus mangrovi]|jgi:glycosyltransferase involved in cell wall biosynthesis|uniref:Glycosyltransferase n=1 Tax=Paracoccus mangrovi TaxID=1715645 RepID=A0ABV7R2J9_9RHOB
MKLGDKAQVAILMAVYQGRDYLPAQLESLAGQSLRDWLLIAGDDGSSDGSAVLLADFAARRPKGQVRILPGPRQGAPANFRALLAHVPPQATHVAFCDQDDVWQPDKLARAVAALPGDGPAIWCSRVINCDPALRQMSLSPLPRHAPGFRHALIQNMVQGNTLLMNRAALDLVAAAHAEAGPVVMHDWWIYQLVTGAGGQVIYDPEPSVLYRQHEGNLVGANNRLRSRLGGLRRMLDGTYRDWSRTNLAALRASAHRLTPENRALLGDFARLHGPLPQRIAAMRRGGFFRQGRVSQAALWLAVLLGRS